MPRMDTLKEEGESFFNIDKNISIDKSDVKTYSKRLSWGMGN